MNKNVEEIINEVLDNHTLVYFNPNYKPFLKLLREKSQARGKEWGEVSLSFRGNELAGEVGEVCNEVKKIERYKLGMKGGKEDISGLAEEIADVMICLDLLAGEFNIDIEEVTRQKFNKTSEKYGLETRI